MEWLQANWFAVAVVVYAALSEIIGMSPLKSNSIVQLLMAVLNKVLVKKG